jgi:hypothetical protein
MGSGFRVRRSAFRGGAVGEVYPSQSIVLGAVGKIWLDSDAGSLNPKPDFPAADPRPQRCSVATAGQAADLQGNFGIWA